MSGNYYSKLSQEIIQELSASIYHHAKNVGIIDSRVEWYI